MEKCIYFKICVIFLISTEDPYERERRDRRERREREERERREREGDKGDKGHAEGGQNRDNKDKEKEGEAIKVIMCDVYVRIKCLCAFLANCQRVGCFRLNVKNIFKRSFNGS